MTHIDLFAGIGGNSLAFDTVFHETKNIHIFCEIDPYPRAILGKHWPGATIVKDVRTFTADAAGVGHIHGQPQVLPAKGSHKAQRQSAPSPEPSAFLLTGGFPCQPFSQAGRRKGTEDDRYLWPAMLGVIRDWKPAWVIAENVRGLVTWNDGMVLETVCSDLEALGYEVQPLIIPACAVGAPHRRDRIWFVAHAKHDGSKRESHATQDRVSKEHRPKDSTARESIGAVGDRKTPRHAPDTISPRSRGEGDVNSKNQGRIASKDRGTGLQSKDRETSTNNLESGDTTSTDSIRLRLERKGSIPKLQESTSHSGRLGTEEWEKDWHEVAARLCGMDDGLPALMDGTTISAGAHRKARLKGLGNAIVPQVAMMIMRAIKQTL